MMSAPDHVAARTFHGRSGAVENRFTYSVDYLLLDPEAKAGPRFFSRNRFNLMSLRDTDFGAARDSESSPAWARRVLSAHGVALEGAKLLLLTQPRVLGHMFNPVSFWLLMTEGGALRAALAEVNNTYGDRHWYVCAHDDGTPLSRHEKLAARKVFHVSPFQPVDGGYSFRFDIRDDRLGIWIDYRNDGTRLLATLTGTRQPLTNKIILRALFRRPLGSRRVLGLIHWQALKLWFKGARWHVRPEPPTQEVSR